jgi:hypothetical protein
MRPKTLVALLLAWLITAAFARGSGPTTMYRGVNPDPNYPRVIQLQHSDAYNGRMYATFEHAITTFPTFKIFESTDSGATWKHVSTLSDTVNGWGMRFQPFLYELPQVLGNLPAGTILAAGNSIPADMSKTKIDIYVSHDHARTWTFLSSVATGKHATPDGNHDPVWEPFLLLANGKLICLYSDERDPKHNQKIVHQTSEDGLTWSRVVEDVALYPADLRPGMPVLARMSNGEYIMSYEIVGLPKIATFVQISKNPEHWNATSQGVKITEGSSPYVVRMGNGDLVLSEADHDHLWLNSSNGSGDWKTVPSPLKKGYSRCLLPLSNGRLFLTVSIGDAITYADMNLP